jgi:hypothetical protein
VSTVHFVSFSGGKPCWRRSQKRLSRELSKLSPESKTLELTSATIQVHIGTVVDLESLAIDFPRGHGLWAWKPFAVAASLSQIDEDDYLFYIDAGCTANRSRAAISRFKEYLSHLDEFGILAFQLSHPENQWSKASLLSRYRLGPDESSSGQVLGTIFAVKNNSYGREIISSWCEGACEDDFFYLKDPTTLEPQLSHFKDHRHDQSVWSCLLKSKSVHLIPDETFYGPNWSRDGSSFPFWATRKCSGNSRIVGESFIAQFYLNEVRRMSGKLRAVIR